MIVVLAGRGGGVVPVAYCAARLPYEEQGAPYEHLVERLTVEHDAVQHRDPRRQRDHHHSHRHPSCHQPAAGRTDGVPYGGRLMADPCRPCAPTVRTPCARVGGLLVVWGCLHAPPYASGPRHNHTVDENNDIDNV